MELTTPDNFRAALRVLVVEDSGDEGQLLERELRNQGYLPELERVTTRSELERALDRAEWDAILCDHVPPRLNAMATLHFVRERGLDLPFIIVSGSITESIAIEIMREGAHDFLFKHSLGRLGAVLEREKKEAAMRAERRHMQQQLLLADRLSSVGMLAAGVAHEINNPLAYVLGNLEFALDHLEGLEGLRKGEFAEVLQALTQAREGSERIRVTTRDLKVFCRTDEDVRTSVNVRRVMESSINIAWNEIRHRAQLVRRFDAVPPIAGNENRLGQVFLNLLVNAAQALPDNRAEQNEISVGIHSDEGNVIIEIADTGTGIEPEKLKRVFDPFFTTKPEGIGSGIGLSICRSIISDLGGEIDVDSRLGKGSTFRVLLPAQGNVLNSRPPRAEAVEVRHSRILVIDDEPALCAVIRRLLRGDHEVLTFVDAREALELLRQDRAFDVIFCDMMMPRMSGIDFFAELDKLDHDLTLRTVFLTGGAFNAQTRQFLTSISNRVIEKPFEAKTLQRVISQMLEKDPLSGTWAMGEVRKAL